MTQAKRINCFDAPGRGVVLGPPFFGRTCTFYLNILPVMDRESRRNLSCNNQYNEFPALPGIDVFGCGC